jgi:hypothetical protein
MIKLRRIGVQAAGRVGFWLGIATSSANIIASLIFLFVVMGIPPTKLPLELWKQVAFSIAITGAVTALAMSLFASIYNLNGMFGGLELEFDMSDTPFEKQKHGDKSGESL